LLTFAVGNSFALVQPAARDPRRRAHLFSGALRPLPADPERMSWWSRLLGGKSERELKPQRLDYLNEALLLERQGDYDAALTSYRLALRDKPDDFRVLQNMAIAYSKTGRLEEAIRCYRRALELEPKLSGAHYGLGFLLLKRGENDAASQHLETFLQAPPASAEAERWVKHATQTLEELRAGTRPEVTDDLSGRES
jgi:tetratricopeptide (TPR) repeat protein